MMFNSIWKKIKSNYSLHSWFLQQWNVLQKLKPYSKSFFWRITLYITKRYQLLNSPKNIKLRSLVLQQCGQIVFPNKRHFSNKVITNMVKKTMQCHVLPIFVKTTTIITTFNLWMRPSWFNTFVLVVNYNNNKREPCHVTIGIF